MNDETPPSPSSPSLAKKLALKRLNRREYSSDEIKRFLLDEGISLENILLVLEELKALNVINDERFTKILARDQATRGKGPRVIQQKLKEKGIPIDLGKTKELMENLTQTSELDTAIAIVQRRYPDSSNDKKVYSRAFQALIRRGFSFSVAREALATYEKETPPPLTDEDFYLDAQGRTVFTKAYHLKRGYCCGSGCIHCPY